MKPKLSLVIGIVCISFSPIFVKLAASPAITSGFYRIFIAWLFLLPYCIIKGKLRTTPKALVITVIGGIVFGADIAMWNISLLKISATVSTLLANLAPVWVGLMSYLLFKKKSGYWFWAGTIVAIIGMVILVGYQNVINLQFNEGILYAVAASILYAIYIMITKGILKHIDTFTFMFYNMLGASVLLLTIVFLRGDALLSFDTATWGCFIGMGVLCQLIGWLTINHSLRYLESTKVSIALLGQTVIAGFLAIGLLGEVLHLKEIIGSVIVLAGIALSFLKTPSRSVAAVGTPQTKELDN
ncbi:DMT family transporter [Mucilaginibacter aquariorum]|uniref:DMT family transporter n=1 Tax=Mucilaginibacter aquariorum TaxID=2967225 RepID=A0ABT1T560_9SPHI|nr:DMT family transporter [Mucilaginibacter aquariorum]MCQ6959762.1 DMT family transporter [Mucilaginibacter aquariorum]